MFPRKNKRKLAKDLKESGTRVIATAIDFAPTLIRVNNRRLMKLQCAYSNYNGTTFIFSSWALRINPLPYLTDKNVIVYHQHDDISLYFVDIEGSVELSEKVVML